MPTTIHPMTPLDIPAVTSLVTTSKFALSINRLLWKNWPDHALQQEQYGNAVKGSVENPDVEALKAVDDDTGEIVGHVVITRKAAVVSKGDGMGGGGDGDGEEKGVKQDMEIPDKFDARVLTAVMEGVSSIEKVTEHLEHINITFIVVHPLHRRKGIGSQLLNVALDRARAANLPVITQSEPLAYEFFKKHGFRDTKHVDWDLGVWAAAPRSGFGVFRLAGVMWEP